MKHRGFFIGFFLLISLQGLAQVVDTVLIRQFSYSIYNGGISNYSATQGPEGLLFFGNSQGVLTYDGSNWELINIGDDQMVLSVLADGERIYVGANDEIGFISKNTQNKWEYTSLNHLVNEPDLINDVWQIVKAGDRIYFQSYYAILVYHNNTITELGVKDAYIFNIDEKILCSSFDGNIKIINGDSVIAAYETPLLEGDAAFSIIKSNKENEYFYFTAENGVWILNASSFVIRPWSIPLSDKLEAAGFYHGLEYHDSLILATTWEEGVILFSKSGDIIRQFDIKRGLPNSELRELLLDENESFWIPTSSGIYQMRLTLDRSAPDFKPITYITSLESASGNSYNLKELSDVYDPERIILTYTTPGFNKEDLEYSFFLDGYDNEWTPWVKQYTKEYSNLKSKTYTFKAKARPLGTTVESLPGEITLSIQLPWYKRTGVYIGVVIVFLILAVSLVRLRAIQLTRAKKRLEIMVNERTKELRMEREKLQVLNSELQVANTELDNFVYRSSHDLIAPLKSLRGLMTVARLDTKDSNMLEYVDMMEKSTLKLETFIRSIMEYSVNAKSQIVKGPVVLKDLLNEIFEEIQYFDKFNSIEFKEDIEVAEIETDAKRLKIILNNLITNAIKYHNLKQDKPYIEVCSKQQGDEVVISVTDNGIGIKREHLDKIFEMFFRATENAEGSGLGLYIVKDTVRQLNGRVEIESEHTKGTRSKIYLPAK